jgi:hypothetical protein
MGRQYHAEKRHAYLDVYSQLDGIRYVAHAAPVAVCFQFARFDRYFDDRARWLETHIGLRGATAALGRAMK